MPLGLNPTLATGILNALFRQQAWPTAPAATWVKFHTGDPGPAGTANAAAYITRTQVTFAAATTFGSVALVSNSGTITLTGVTVTEVWRYFSVWTASTAGTFFFSGTVSGGSVTAGSPTIAVGNLNALLDIAF